MKRSEAIEEIKYFMYGDSQNPAHMDEAISLLNMLEYKLGLVPPELVDKSWKLEDNGVMTYAVHEWEKE